MLACEKFYGGKIKPGRGIGSVGTVEILHRVVRKDPSERVAYGKM